MADTPAPAPAAQTAAAASASADAPAAGDERDAKGKLCAGHLKRWYDYPKEVEALAGANAEIYRCEFCHTLYRPDPQQMPNSYTLNY